MNKLLEIRNLRIQFSHHNQIINAVDGVNLDVREGEVLALVGESGSGKTLTSLSITRILPEAASITSGEIIFQNTDLLKADLAQIESIRGKEISYIFQEPTASLNPVLTIGKQIEETILLHRDVSRKEPYDLAIDLLTLVRLPNPHNIMRNYPHQLSGGMNQRVMIAMALSSNPKLLIADEPTTALDVTIEKDVINVILELKERFNYSILFITHNLSLVRKFANRIAIMFRGRIVEEGEVGQIFDSPKHEHTKDLVSSIIQL